MLRAVKCNMSSDVIAIGFDEDQAGQYHDCGTWCDFAFREDQVPAPPADVRSYIKNWATDNNKDESDFPKQLLKVDGSTIVAKTLAEVQV